MYVRSSSGFLVALGAERVRESLCDLRPQGEALAFVPRPMKIRRRKKREESARHDQVPMPLHMALMQESVWPLEQRKISACHRSTPSHNALEVHFHLSGLSAKGLVT